MDKLSPRQKQIIELLIQDYSEKEIARMLNLSEDTIWSYISTAREQAGVSHKSALIAKYIRLFGYCEVTTGVIP
jgi:DNA-binding CsgD family transcriptional regulator